MKIAVPLVLVAVIAGIAWVCTSSLQMYAFFGIVLPYAAFILFVVGFSFRIIRWGRSAVPFCIPTTCGQQKSLPWIKQAKTDNPSSYAGVIGRMLLEIFLFRSLFRNSKVEKRDDGMTIGSAKWLWLFGLMFHWSMLVIVIRHFRLFLDPVPQFIQAIESVDGMFQIGLPILYLTDVFILAGLTFLFLRRVVIPRIRFISLSVDFFPLFLLLGIAITGVLMRYVFRVDVAGIKEITMGLVTLHPVASASIEPIFYVHLGLVCTLLIYFPWSKLMHSGGVFLSPTRNLANDSRMRRHINPWNYKVKVHTYAEYEEEFGEKMKKVGLPLDSEE